MGQNPLFSSDNLKLISKCEDPKSIAVRQLKPTDFHKIALLVKAIEPLRQYDNYIYKLFCDYFSKTCLLMERNNELIGLAIGFCLPNEQDAFAILQFGVIEEYRRKNIAVNFFRIFLQQFSNCSRFYFTVRASNPKGQQIKRLIENVTKSPCTLRETIKFSVKEWDYKYECRYDKNNLSIYSNQFD